MDFYEPINESIRGYRVLLVIIRDAISFVWVIPLKQRSECVENVKKLIGGVRAWDSTTIDEKVIHRALIITMIRGNQVLIMKVFLIIVEITSIITIIWGNQIMVIKVFFIIF